MPNILTTRLGRFGPSLQDWIRLQMNAPDDPAVVLGSKLLSWWDFTDPETIFTDTAGTITANPGDNIARINDKAGVMHCIQATVGEQPVLQNDFSAYFETARLRFSGSVGLPLGANPCEMYAVVRQDHPHTFSGIAYAFSYGNTASNNLRGFGRQNDATPLSRAVVRIGTGATNSGGQGSLTRLCDGRRVIGAIVTATNYYIVSDDTIAGPVAAVPNTSDGFVCIGAHSGASITQPWFGKIMHVVVTDPLDTAERAALLAYLMHFRSRMDD